jgi:glutaredoxin/glutathione-dependent peroxiredoxin
MAIKVGDRIPDVKLMTMTGEGPKPVQSGEVLGSGTVVLFAVPGAFTPTCSDYHLPGFVLRADDLKGKGVDTIACLAVNDPFVMGAWARDQKCSGKVRMMADGVARFSEAIGLAQDLSAKGMLGVRSQRYSMLVKDGVVKALNVEQPGKFEVSDAATLLDQARKLRG